jgi:formylglycine-generating enzyme required for sulfatase activity
MHAFRISGAILSLIALAAALSLLAQSPSPAKPSVNIEFAKIAAGEFTMGCSAAGEACDADEKPAHRVQITKAFEIGKYEVTQAQWEAVMGSNPSTIKGENRPVETISKEEAHDFLAHLNALNDGYHYRLPTEAEWEYAARAGSSASPRLDEVAWYADNSGDETHPVGQKKPNTWGLYDTLGNVREWVEDQYGRDYYSTSPSADPTGPTTGQGSPRGGAYRGVAQPQDGGGGGFRGRNFGGRGPVGGRGRVRQLPVVRGGGWDNAPGFVRLSARYHYYGPTLRVSDIGFRAARDPIQSAGGSPK